VSAAAHAGDLILTLGAGSVSQLAPQILAGLEGNERAEVPVGPDSRANTRSNS
jgi:hypothetical protein